jgi:small nuclear ribonucleoprotein E
MYSNPAIVLLQPITFIFKLLQAHSKVSIWLYENLNMRIEGRMRVCSTGARFEQWLTRPQGFDEFMNLVVDEAIEVTMATKDKEESRRKIGRLHAHRQSEEVADSVTGQILLKGDNITLIQSID